MVLGAVALGLAVWLMETWLSQAGTSADSADILAADSSVFYQGRRFCIRQRAGNHSVFTTRSGATIWLAERTSILGRRSGGDDHSRPSGDHCRFIGFLVAGLAGSIMASIGIFLPVYLFTIIPAPWFKRHRNNPQLKAFVDGATAAATGAITGAVIVLAARAITDLPTAAIALISLGVLWRYKIPEPVIVTISGVVGLILWPLLRLG